MSEEEKDIEQQEGEQFETSKGYGQQYDLPSDQDAFVDVNKGEIIDKDELTPFEQIKIVAEKTGNVINDPKPSCKHCYGRGYQGIDSATRSPIPCNCIYPKKSAFEKQQEQDQDRRKYGPPSRAQKRKMKRLMRKEIIKQRKRGDFKELAESITQQKIEEMKKDMTPEELEKLEVALAKLEDEGKEYNETKSK